MPGSVDFFENQFQRQVREGEFALNPFEKMSLDYLRGSVLDLGCGLGNLSVEAARRGCRVTAVDMSPTGIRRIQAIAEETGLPLEGVEADLETYRITSHYDTIVAIGLLMFFPRQRALSLLEEIQTQVRPGGRAILNALIEGTTYMGMFQPGNYCLFRGDEFEEHFADWKVLFSSRDSFPAPEKTCKEFTTIVAERPS